MLYSWAHSSSGLYLSALYMSARSSEAFLHALLRLLRSRDVAGASFLPRSCPGSLQDQGLAAC